MLAKICCPVRKTFRGELTKPAGIELPYPDTSLIREEAFLSQFVFVDGDHRAHVLRNRAAHQPRCSFRNALRLARFIALSRGLTHVMLQRHCTSDMRVLHWDGAVIDRVNAVE